MRFNKYELLQLIIQGISYRIRERGRRRYICPKNLRTQFRKTTNEFFCKALSKIAYWLPTFEIQRRYKKKIFLLSHKSNYWEEQGHYHNLFSMSVFYMTYKSTLCSCTNGCIKIHENWNDKILVNTPGQSILITNNSFHGLRNCLRLYETIKLFGFTSQSRTIPDETENVLSKLIFTNILSCLEIK